jgi:hypothetical protein
MASAMPTSNSFDHLIPKQGGAFDHLVPKQVEGDNQFSHLVPNTSVVKRTEGFVDNIRAPWDNLQDAIGSSAHGAAEEGMVQRGMKYLFKSDEEKKRVKERLLGREKELDTISQMLDQLESAGETNTDQYRELESKFYALSDMGEEEAPPSVPTLSAIVDAFKHDAGAAAAELVNAAIADPALLAVPMGWEKAAASAAARTAQLGKTAQAIAAVGAGATGAAAVGAALTVPISATRQLDEYGDVNWDAVAQEAKIAGAVSAPIAGLFRGVTNLPRIRFGGSPAEEVAHQSAGASAVSPSAITLEESVSKSRFEVPEVLRDFTEIGGFKAITKLDRLAEVSPSIKKLRDMLEYTEFSKTPIGPSYYEGVSLATGKYLSRLQEQMDSLTGGWFRKSISKDVNDDLLLALRGGEAKAGVSVAAKNIRGLLDDFYDYLKSKGLEPGYIKGYFPRKYLANELQKSDKMQGDFVGVLTKHGIPIEDADEIIRRIIIDDGVYIQSPRKSNRAIDSDGYFHSRVGQSGTSKNANIESARKLARIPDEELAPFLDNNVYDVLKKYISAGVNRAEFASRFGAGEGVANNLIRKGIQEAIDSGVQPKRSEIKRAYDLLDAIQHRYNPIQSRAVREAQRALGAYQLLRTLSLATISSLAEPMIILARGRWDSALKALPAVISHASRSAVRSVFKKFPKSEATRAAEQVGLALDMGITERMLASFGGEMTRVTEAFFKATLLHQWTKLNRVAGFHTGRMMIADNLRDLMRGASGAKQKKLLWQLTELGIDAEDGIQWLRQGAPDNHPFTESLNAGALRFTNEVVMSPRATVRPMWHSDPRFHLISQLKGFQTVFGNTVMKRFLHEVFEKGVKEGGANAVKYATVGTMMIMVAALGNDLREYIKYGPGGNPKFKDEPAFKRIMRAVDRAGFTGAFQIAIDAFYAHRFGNSGISQIAGPALSQLDQLALEAVPKALGLGGEKASTATLKTELTNAIPIINANKATRDWVRDEVISPAVDAALED